MFWSSLRAVNCVQALPMTKPLHTDVFTGCGLTKFRNHPKNSNFAPNTMLTNWQEHTNYNMYLCVYMDWYASLFCVDACNMYTSKIRHQTKTVCFPCLQCGFLHPQVGQHPERKATARVVPTDEAEIDKKSRISRWFLYCIFLVDMSQNHRKIFRTPLSCDACWNHCDWCIWCAHTQGFL